MMDDEKFDNLFPSAYQQSDVPEKKECRFCCIGWDSWKTIFISTIATIFALIGMIITQFAYHGQIQLQYDQLKTDYESNNTYYEAQLTHKVTGRQVVEGLESLRSSVRAQTRGLRNELNGIEVARSGKEVVGVNCMLQTNSKDPESEYCCALLSQDVTPKTDMQRLNHCFALMLSLRYGVNDEESTVMHHEVRSDKPGEPVEIIKTQNSLPQTCTIKNNKRAMLTVCCTFKTCSDWEGPAWENMCNLCRDSCPACLDKILYG